MYLGKIVEVGNSEEIYRNAQHPYTQSLIAAIPVPDPHRQLNRQVLVGDVPSPIAPPSGCAFHPRCPQVMDRCKSDTPQLAAPMSNTEHLISCHLMDS
jgi:oligopeptide/dipeptide ABC transporter ATP-binding protein